MTLIDAIRLQLQTTLLQYLSGREQLEGVRHQVIAPAGEHLEGQVHLELLGALHLVQLSARAHEFFVPERENIKSNEDD